MRRQETGFSEGQNIWPGNVPTFLGMNLLFGGDVSKPGISVYSATSNTAGAASAISAIAGDSPDLPMYGTAPGAGTLTFQGGDTTVTLTNFAFYDPRVFNIDRIANFEATPDGNRDYVGGFALEVTSTPIPEPSAFPLFGAAVTALPGSRFLKRRFTS